MRVHVWGKGVGLPISAQLLHRKSIFHLLCVCKVCSSTLDANKAIVLKSNTTHRRQAGGEQRQPVADWHCPAWC